MKKASDFGEKRSSAEHKREKANLRRIASGIAAASASSAYGWSASEQQLLGRAAQLLNAASALRDAAATVKAKEEKRRDERTQVATPVVKAWFDGLTPEHQVAFVLFRRPWEVRDIDRLHEGLSYSFDDTLGSLIYDQAAGTLAITVASLEGEFRSAIDTSAEKWRHQISSVLSRKGEKRA